MADFWNGEMACGEFLNCPPIIYSRCPAYRDGERPCWEQPITECRKVLDFQWDCGDCKVLKTYHGAELFLQRPELDFLEKHQP